MKKIKELIIVEGKTDVAFLSSFLKADFYVVNGSAINNKNIDEIKTLSKNKGIIILTDPDFPGMKIRNFLNQNFPNSKNAFVDKNKSIKKHKVGVAESTKDEVLKALNNLVTYQSENINFKKIDLYNLGLFGKDNSKILRDKLCNKLNIGYSSSKELLKKLNSLNNLDYNKLEEIINAL